MNSSLPKIRRRTVGFDTQGIVFDKNLMRVSRTAKVLLQFHIEST